jgi:Cu2+-exporting ATPase
VQDFEVEAGSGVSGTSGGTRYRIGRPEWAEELDLPLPEPLAERLRPAEGRGESVVLLMDEQGVRALFALGDRVRPSAKRAVSALQQRGVTVVMITGDAEAVARTVAEELGIERTYARVRPDEKAERIRALQREGATAFVGDGINDAPALLGADLGVAIGAGTNVAIESADLVLVENDPRDIVRVLTLSRATYGKMVQNLAWATGYNVVAIPLAAGVLAPVGVLLSPAVGALLMSVSTIIVAVNAMLLRRVSIA